MGKYIEIEKGDTIVITDDEGVQYTLYDVFLSNTDLDKFKTTDDEDDDTHAAVLDVTLSAFGFDISGGMPPDDMPMDDTSDVCKICEDAEYGEEDVSEED
jgi:hypothetical protein